MQTLSPNGLTPFQQQISTFCAAIAASLLTARIIATFVWNTEQGFTIIAIFSLLYFLVGGAYLNGGLEHSVQGFLGRPTPWVLINGLSWGLPRPFGQSLFRRSIAPQTSNFEGENAIAQVNARDGGQVSVGVVKQWRICDVRLAGQFTPEVLASRVRDVEDRGVRWFALYYDSDGTGANNLTHQKAPFSRYLIGDETLTEIKLFDERGVETGTYRIDHNDPNSMRNKFALLGVEAITAEVKDVNPPQEVIDARNGAAAEAGQAESEKRDIASFRARVLEAQYGTSDPDEMKRLRSQAGFEPAMSREDAVREVRAARKNLTDINVSGSAGDFTKGAALGGTKQP